MNKKLEKRAQIISEARQWVDKADAEKRSMSAEEQTNFDKAMDDADVLQKEAEQEDRLATAERSLGESTGRKIPDFESEDANKEKQEKEYNRSFDKWIRRGSSVLDKEETRALETQTGSEGGFSVGTEFETQLNKYIGLNNVMRNLMRIISTKSDRAIPVVTSQATVGQTAEEAASPIKLAATGAVPPAGDPALGQVTIGSFKYSRIVLVSEELLHDSFINVSEWVGEELGEAVANIEEDMTVNGTNINQPQGCLQFPVGVTVTSPAVTLDNLIDLEYSVPRLARKNGKFLLGDEMARELRKAKDGESRYLWEVSVKIGEPSRLLGYPVYVSDQMPDLQCGKRVAAFGWFERGFYFAQRIPRSVTRLSERYIDQGQIGFRIVTRFDSKIVNNRAVRTIKVDCGSS